MEEIKDKSQGEQVPAKPITILITLLPSGNVNVESPVLFDKILCFGILQAATMAIMAHQPQGPIIQPKGNILDFARKFKKRF
mgnify:CR=1 FL=1